MPPKSIHVVLLLSLLVWQGCTGTQYPFPQPSGDFPDPSGELIFAIRIVDFSLGDPLTGNTGHFFYLSWTGGTPSFPSVSIYEYHNGYIVDRVTRGSREARRLLEDLQDINIKQFDFDEEINEARRRWDDSFAQGGERRRGLVVTDGFEYEITFNYDDNYLILREWNPVPLINHYADYSAQLSQLKYIMDVFATHYGRGKLRL